MRNLSIILTSIVGLSLFAISCNKDSSISEDTELIQQIVESENRSTIDPSDLPTITKITLDEEYFETYIENVVVARGLGFEVELGNGENIYFSERGEGLVSRRGFRHGHGPCGMGHRGTRVPIANLPTSIVDYIAANYLGAETKRAKTNNSNGNYFVLIKTDDGRVVLKFDADGNFIEEVSCIYHGCGGIIQVDVADLLTTIVDYIIANYPTADIQKAGQKINSGNYGVVLNIDGDRVIVVFDEGGNFLFERS